MSVPAHAPYDHIALVDSGEKIDPITIIDVKDLGLNPAKKVCDELGIKNQNETEKLDEVLVNGVNWAIEHGYGL